MLTRRSLLAGIAGCAVRRSRAATPAFLDFVHVTDTHVIEPSGVHPRLVEMRRIFAHTRAALPRDLMRFERDWKAGFAFVTGDLVDVYSFLGKNEDVIAGQVEAFSAIVAASPLPFYAGLGNHDVQHYGLLDGRLAPDQSNLEQAKAAWVRHLPCFQQGTYYAFHRDLGKTRWRFIMLNNGFYGHLPGPARRPRQYGLGLGQADWLAEQCRRCHGDPLIVGVHIPPADAALAEIEQVLGERRRLTLLFTGHIHESNFIKELPFAKARTFQVATPAYATGSDHFRRVRLYEDRVEIAVTGGRGEGEKTLDVGGR